MLLRDDLKRRHVRCDAVAQCTVPPVSGDDNVCVECLASAQRERCTVGGRVDIVDGGVVKEWHALGVEARAQDVVQILVLWAIIH